MKSSQFCKQKMNTPPPPTPKLLDVSWFRKQCISACSKAKALLKGNANKQH